MNYTYYGRSDGAKPTIGVTYDMIDTQIKNIMEKRITLFQKELAKLMVSFKKEMSTDINGVKSELARMKEEIKKITTKTEDKRPRRIKDEVNLEDAISI